MQITPYIHKTQFYETDQMGIVHHSNYIRWFEEARVDFMEKMGFGYEKAMARGIDVAVLGVACDYKSMVRFGENVAISASIINMSPTRMTVGYCLSDSVTGQLRTTGESRHCFLHSVKKQPVSLKKEIPELYALFSGLAETSR